jgi:hypothetical protein
MNIPTELSRPTVKTGARPFEVGRQTVRKYEGWHVSGSTTLSHQLTESGGVADEDAGSVRLGYAPLCGRYNRVLLPSSGWSKISKQLGVIRRK